MKKIVKIIIAIAGITFISSCKDMLEAPTQSSLDEAVIFSTPALAEGAIAGIIQSFAETNSYRGRYLVFYGINTDTEISNSLKSIDDDKSRLSNYNTNVNNSQMNTDNNAWAKFYEGIERANLAIRGIRTYGDVEHNPQLAQILGEMLTLRAVVYSDLIKGWGDVPARFEPISSETLYLPRSDRDVIYKQLLADLEEASNLLAWPNETPATKSVERVNKAFAKGLRARLALAAGGYAQRMDGTVRLSTDPDLSRDKMYAIAKKECLDIINSGKLRLLGFEEVFKTLNQETGVAGKESMWEIPFSEGRGRVIFDLGVKHTTTDKYTMQNKGGTNGPNALMLYEYQPGDVRRDVTVVPYEWTNGVQVPTNLNKLYFGKYRYEWMKRIVTSTNDDGLNWMYMRYADVLLMAAEAINEIDGPAAAAPYLKMVRQRAFPANAAKVDQFMAQVTASKTTFFDAIVNERALEFTGEMLRKADLIRWNLLETKLNEAKAKLIQLENRQGIYVDVPKTIYYKTAADGESVVIYGLNMGEKDIPDPSLGFTSNKSWTLSSSTDQNTYWDALVYKNRSPNKQQVWPIWQYFIDNSNGLLDNKHLDVQ
ncbi:putative outer membrane starch-binding protein [Arcticibacter tournemirensis]|uniref:RagB/SusD family nutrient uptake outer membrane protein n=1 Tax=Arcticibacter tournemirensis TaxID=699437 RepID=A0A5M9H485_9SPHI|nr:RagB/SusD family nutrient uptake outer membrane protein [Arcticibacter tournemirensis]KAA8481420.1 RagB/SusD family nutrient uptake outer membrane protein [Arcticibacter tournemirensis]TQM49006.1 putative outer membrane starch-binding protein [Arcticibacter tournemirensis]